MIRSAVVACWDAFNVRKTVHLEPRAMVFLALLLLSSSIQLADATKTVQLTFHLSAEEFDTFTNGFVTKLKNEVDGYSFSNGHHILPLEVIKEIDGVRVSLPPNTWIKIELIGEGDKSCSLFLRADNLYLVAFATEAGQIYYMGDYGAVFTDGRRLNFDLDYKAMLGPERKENVPKLLSEVLIGRSEAQAQSTVLADYDPAKDSDAVLGKALVPFVLMFSEAMRLKPILDSCRQHWKLSGHLTEKEAGYTRIWDSGSFVWCTEEEDPKKWTDTQRTDLRRRKIKTLAQIEPVLFIVKRPGKPAKGCPPAANNPVPAHSNSTVAAAA